MSYLSWLYRWSHGASPKLSQSLPKLIGGAGTLSLGWTDRRRVQGEAVSQKRGTSREVHGTSAFLALSWEQPTARLEQTSAGPDDAQSERCDGTRFTFRLSWRSDSMWIRAFCLDIKVNDRSRYGQGQVLIAKCWRQNRSRAVWCSSSSSDLRKWPQLLWRSMEILQSRGSGLCFKKAFRHITHSKLPCCPFLQALRNG